MGRKEKRFQGKGKEVPRSSHKKKSKQAPVPQPAVVPRPPPSLYQEKVLLLWVFGQVRPRPSTNILRLISGEYLGLFVSLLAIHPKQISSDFDCVHRVWLRRYDLYASGVFPDSSIVSLGGTRTFVCGSQKKVREAFVLESGCEELSTRMRERHVYPGLVYEPQTASVFVFGGFVGFENGHEAFFPRCEQYFVQADLWRRIPDLPVSLGRFNPCLFRGLIYLVGGRQLVVHAYSYFFREYTAFPPIPLPPSSSAWLSPCCFVYREQVTVLYSSAIAQWDSHSWTAQEFEPVRGRYWSSCAPAVYQHSLYLVVNQTCVVFDLKKLVQTT